MSVWWAVLLVMVTGLLVARRWLPDRELLADTAYDMARTLVPPPRPTVRIVTRRIARACARRRVIMAFGQKAVLPRSFTVDLHPDEYAVVGPLLDTVAQAVGASLERTARAKQWQHAGIPEVFLRVGDDVAEGRPVVTATTLPRPAATAQRTSTLPAERTSTLPAERTSTLPAERTSTLSAERTSTLSAERTSTVALYAEPTAAESEPPVARVHRLRSVGADAADIVVDRGPITVGRAPECGLVIAYAAASRRHFRVSGGSTGAQLEDLGSRHGTRVNGRPVTAPVLLRARDVVQIGTAGPCWRYEPEDGQP